MALRNNWTDGAAFFHTDQNDVANEVNAKVDKATLTAKGDLYVATNSGTITNLPVGSNDQVLMADSTQTTGVKWGTVSNGTFADTSFTLQDNGDATKQVKFEVSGITTGTTRTFTLPDANTTLVGTDTTQTLSNKTISGASNTLSSIGVSSLSATGTASSTTYLRGDGTWATISNGTFLDTNFTLQDDGDTTKQIKFQLSGVTTGTTRTLTVPDASSTLEVTANKGQANGYASLGSDSKVPTIQLPAGVVIDGVTVVGDAFQLYSGATAIGSPVSLLIATVDGGSPSTTSDGYIDGGTL